MFSLLSQTTSISFIYKVKEESWKHKPSQTLLGFLMQIKITFLGYILKSAGFFGVQFQPNGTFIV